MQTIPLRVLALASVPFLFACGSSGGTAGGSVVDEAKAIEPFVTMCRYKIT